MNDKSTAKDFVERIGFWLENVPEWEQPNWVLGNHDQKRVASRYTPKKALSLAFFEMTLRGYAVIYNVSLVSA